MEEPNWIRQKFLAYEGVRESGETNMWDVRRVIELAEENYDGDISEDDVLYIIGNYEELAKTYLHGKQ